MMGRSVTLDKDFYTCNKAARGHLPTAINILHAPNLSNMPIRIPSGSVGKRQYGIISFKSNDDFLSTPYCKQSFNVKQFSSKMLMNYGNTKEPDGSPSASSSEAGSTLSPPQASASPSANDCYNIFMPAYFMISSWVAYVMIHGTWRRLKEAATVGITSAMVVADTMKRRWQYQHSATRAARA
jgi:hypothetical protein